MKKIIAMILFLIICTSFVGCQTDNSPAQNSGQNKTYSEENGNQNSIPKQGRKFYSAQITSFGNDELEVAIIEEVDENYDFNKPGIIGEAKEKDPNEKDEQEDDASPFSIYKITEEVILEDSTGKKLDKSKLTMAETIVLEIENDKLIRIIAE